MAHLITMPAVVADAEDAVLASWLAKVGDDVTQGQPIAEIETEKAMVELEATGSGTLNRLLVEAGDVVTVGAPVAGLLESGEDESSLDDLLAELSPDKSAEEVSQIKVDAMEGAEEEKPNEATTTAWETDQQRVFASPLARKMAKDSGISFETLTGSGPNGRIIRSDVEAAIAAATSEDKPEETPTVESAPAPAPEAVPAARYREEKASPMRRAIARRLSESKSSIPHFYLTVDVFMDALLELRGQVNEQLEQSGIRVTVNEFLVKALAAALLDVPEANATWHGETIRYYTTADIAVAVATDGGLITPVVTGVDQRSLSSVHETMTDIKERSQSGRIRQDELEGGTFTLSNLGMYGTREFSAIINPPHAGIIATGGTEERVVAIDGDVTTAKVMTATLSADHRVVDGAVGARLMQSFKEILENPLRLLI